jgi:hypothetical protein
LRCQTATLADAAGVSPRVVQRLMRHSTLELTGRYTRPRAVDIEAAASLLPSLKPTGNATEPLAATGTDGQRSHQPLSERSGTSSENACPTGLEGQRISEVLSHYFPTGQAGIEQQLPETGEMKASSLHSLMGHNTLENKGVGAQSRVLAGTVENTGDGTRTHDLRIMRPPL